MPGMQKTLEVKDAVLVIVGGADQLLSDQIVVDHLPIRMGRGRENDLVLSHALVSRAHCELFERDGVLFVRDLGSTNGTFVGSRRVQESPLRPGDLLTVGIVTFRAVYGGFASDGPLHDGEMPSSENESPSISILDTVPVAVDASSTLIDALRRPR
jgi:pSer/pThr/pTyr-binding forkhead associated (FHA) protein